MSKDDRKAYKLVEPPSRTANVGLAKLINKRSLTVGGFTCDLCNATFTVYDAYLDHCHSRVHLQKAGWSESDIASAAHGGLERVDDPGRIRARLQWLKEQRDQQREQRVDRAKVEQRIEEKLIQRQKEAEEEGRRRRKAKQSEPSQEEQPSGEIQLEKEEADMMAQMIGFTSFK